MFDTILALYYIQNFCSMIRYFSGKYIVNDADMVLDFFQFKWNGKIFLSFFTEAYLRFYENYP